MSHAIEELENALALYRRNEPILRFREAGRPGYGGADRCLEKIADIEEAISLLKFHSTPPFTTVPE